MDGDICGALRGPYRCEQPAGHAGLHRASGSLIHGPMLWSPDPGANARWCPLCGQLRPES